MHREATLLVAQTEVMQQLRAALNNTNVQLQAKQRHEDTQQHNDELHKPFWEFLAISRWHPVWIWHAKKMATVSHRPIKTQTCYVMVFTPYNSRCSSVCRLLFGNLTGDVLNRLFKTKDTRLKYVILTEHAGTAGFLLNVLRDTAA